MWQIETIASFVALFLLLSIFFKDSMIKYNVMFKTKLTHSEKREEKTVRY